MQKNANETAKETKNMFLQSAKELKAVHNPRSLCHVRSAGDDSEPGSID